MFPMNKNVKSFAAKWILKTSETRKLTRAATQGVINDVSEMIDYILMLLKEQVHGILTANDVDSSILLLAQITDIFSGSITKPFAGLASFHLQLEYYRKNYNLIVSCIIQ